MNKILADYLRYVSSDPLKQMAVDLAQAAHVLESSGGFNEHLRRLSDATFGVLEERGYKPRVYMHRENGVEELVVTFAEDDVKVPF